MRTEADDILQSRAFGEGDPGDETATSARGGTRDEDDFESPADEDVKAEAGSS